ncbi:ABC transporter ATP-binding protein [Candidatus Sumerlaeota bacterium]|nr:ABC transporter ATP-binding protein [Candidatus Sumerlaeota bacterium]
MVELRNLVKRFEIGEVVVEALRGVSLSIEHGEYTAIMGPSGSGKSTLMNILGCLDTPTEGSYTLDGHDVSSLSDDVLSDIRGSKIGFVFQSFNLIGQLSVLENIEVPMIYQGRGVKECSDRAKELAERVGMGHRVKHLPRELSGGEQQRIAIARALVNDPLIIMADEPTGNLDTKNGEAIMKIFDDLHEEGKTILIVTHEPELREITERVIHFRDGLVESDEAGGRARR